MPSFMVELTKEEDISQDDARELAEALVLACRKSATILGQFKLGDGGSACINPGGDTGCIKTIQE